MATFSLKIGRFMRRVREYDFVPLNFRPPRRLRWAFRKVGSLYQVRGVGKYRDLTVEPRWGWESLYRMLGTVFGLEEGGGGTEGVVEAIRERFRRLVEEYSKGHAGYRTKENDRGIGRLLPHRYDPLRPTVLPAVGDDLGEPKEILWLNYLLKEMGYEVSEYEVPPEGAFRMKFLDEPTEEVWKLAYVIEAGMFGAGDRGFLLNTPYLFEEYVGREFGGVRVRPMEWGIRPDFVLGDGTPMDAKYKVRPTRADVYQAFTYATLMGSRRALLVYPKVVRTDVTLGEVKVEIRGAF